MTTVYCSSCNKTRLKPGHPVRISRKNGGILCNRCYQREKENSKKGSSCGGGNGFQHHPPPRGGLVYN